MIGVMWCQPERLGDLALFRDGRRVLQGPLPGHKKEPRREFHTVTLTARSGNGDGPERVYDVVLHRTGRALKVVVHQVFSRGRIRKQLVDVGGKTGIRIANAARERLHKEQEKGKVL